MQQSSMPYSSVVTSMIYLKLLVMTYLIQIFAEFVKKDVANELKAIAEKVADTAPYEDEMMEAFEAIKSKLAHKFIIVTDAYFEATGIRFAQQIQENAKHEAFTHVLPEANHNVIESYYGNISSLFIFIDSGKNERVSARFEFLINSKTYFDKSSIILDFFSGSATTAHATMQLNAEDGGNRKYIMVQLPEMTDEKSAEWFLNKINQCVYHLPIL